MHARSAGLLALSIAALPAPAAAQEGTRLPLGSVIQEVVAAPDGGAWVDYAQAQGSARLGRLSPDGDFRSVAAGGLGGGLLGLDGHAWFTRGERGFVRADANLRITRFNPARRFPGPFAIGPDATLWTPADDFRMAHIAPTGAVAYSPALQPACTTPGSEQSEYHEMVRAADGAMWITDFGCDRLLRITATGTTSVQTHVTSFALLTPDASGGVWLAPVGDGAVTRVDAAGAVQSIRLPLGEVSDIAVAPDGSAWLAHGRCRLTRVDPAGGTTLVTTPIVTHRVDADATGRLLLTGVTRLVRFRPGTPAGACDDEGPTVRVRPSAGRISLAALRRGFRVSVREPAEMIVLAVHFDRPDPRSADFTPRETRQRITSGPATLRYRISAKRLRRYARRLAEGRRPRISLAVRATDANGNETEVVRALRVTR
jgi:hypothetical protein